MTNAARQSADPSAPKTVFVTGANGFVGSHLVRALVGDGHRVRALVRARSNRSLVDGLPLEWVTGDLDDRDAMRQGCDGVDWVVHVAGRVNAPRSEDYFRANHTGTVNLLESVIESAPGLERFVYISSQAAAGPTASGRPRAEDDPDHPNTDYGESKLAGELAVRDLADRLPFAVIRPPAVFGPGDTETLEIFKAVRHHIKPVFGPRPARLSLVYVTDLVRGILLALTSPAAQGELFYIAEERHYDIAELEDLMQKALGTWAVRVRIPAPVLMTLAYLAEQAGRIGRFDPKLNRLRARNFLVPDWTLSVEKANRLLGYESTVPFAAGAVASVVWYREHGWL